jgi:predicted TIM-barrel fold metal-dependent hydrolase
MHADSLAAQLENVPVVNVHTHVYGHAQCRPLTEVVPFFCGLYLGGMLPFADRRLAARVADRSRGDRERWADFLLLWPHVKHTGFGRVARHVLKNWDIEGDLADVAYDVLAAKLQQRSPEYSRLAHGRAGIVHTISNVVGHSDLEWETITDFLAGRFPSDPAFSPLLSTVPLHTFKTRADLEPFGRVAGVEIRSLGDLEHGVDVVIQGAVDRGIVGLKNHCAYRRGLDIGPMDRQRAEQELARLLGGEARVDTTGLSDTLFHRIVQRAVDHHLPVAVHAGMLAANAHPRTNVALMAPIFEAYPEARFDLYHLNYPWIEDGIAILKRFPNTWANCAWTHIVDPHAVVEFLRRAVGAIPSSHIFGFGSDGHDLPESVLAHLAVARSNIAAALAGAVDAGQCGKSDALAIARQWLYDNPVDFYKLPVLQKEGVS